MATDLHDRLADLAAHTPAASPPTDLWARGVRRHRATQAGRAVVVAVLVALIGLGGWTWQSARPVEPSDTHGSPQLPDTFYDDVSPWTHTFDGPPGPLITVFPNVRETLRHTTNGIIGVTADSSTYGFLDLPDAAAASDDLNAMALSPDGRHVAFWVTGTPSGSPNTTMVAGYTLTGVAWYDTVTGELRESRFPTLHGLEPGALLWADDSTLLLSYGQIQGADGTELETTSSAGGSAAWRISSARPEALPDVFSMWMDSSYTRATNGRVVTPGRRAWLAATTSDPSNVRSFRTNRSPELMVPSPDGRRVVAVLRAHSDTGQLAIARVPRRDGGRTVLHQLSLGRVWTRPLAWIDDDHVAVGREIPMRDHVGSRLDSVDLRTGSVRPLVENVGLHGTSYADPRIALDLLGAPSVKAEPPPSPPDLRAWTIGLLVAAGIALLVGVPILCGSRGRRA